MRRWIALAARLYPHAWRERYESEFGALIEDAPADWRQFWNVMRAAVAMQFAVNRENLRIVGAAALAGTLLAAAASFRVPPSYVSSMVVRIDPVVTPGATVLREVVRRETDDRIEILRNILLFRQRAVRNASTPVKERRAIGWYTPPELDVWADVEDPIRAGGEIQAEPVYLADPGGPGMRISFDSPDRREAQATVEKLTPIMVYSNGKLNSGNAMGPFPFPVTIKLDRIAAANLPSAFAERRRSLLVAVGAGAGLLLGSLVAFFRRRLKFGLRLAACGFAGCLLAAAVSMSISERYTATTSFHIATPRDPLGWTLAIPARPFREQAPLVWDEVIAGNDLWKTLQTSYRIRDEVFEVTVSHAERSKSEQLANQLTQAVARRYQTESQVGEHLVGIRMSPTDDARPTHYRMELTIAGAFFGILTGIRLPRRSPIPV